MYQLLIVEDERWEREGLRDFLDWRSLGIEVAGCASNGVEGLKMAELHKPDIILTDIMMPKMDGIQMSQKIRTFLPYAKIIILSGYDDFQYAKQSIGFQASAYILKPVEKKALEENLFSVIKVLNQEKMQNMEITSLQKQWTNYISENGNRLLLNLLEYKTELKVVQEMTSVIGLELYGKKVTVILYLFQDNEKEQPSRHIPHICNPEFINKFQELMKKRGIAYSFRDSYKEAVLCLNAPSAQSELEIQLVQLLENLKSEFGIEAIAGVGDTVEDFSRAPKSYLHAKEAASYRFLAGYGELLFYDQLKETDILHWEDSRSVILKTSSITKKIVYSLQKDDLGECELMIDAFLSILRKYRVFGKILLNIFFTEFMSRFYSPSAENSYEDMLAAAYDHKWFDMDMTALDSLLQTRQFIKSSLKSITTHSCDKKGLKDDEVAVRVIQIIEERYSDEMDLKLISEEIHLSPYYIGSIFKKYTGKVFSQYLNDYRIDMAKELLHKKNMKISQLAETVGIPNSSYFCMLFKNRFGISPGEYNDSMKGRREYV